MQIVEKAPILCTAKTIVVQLDFIQRNEFFACVELSSTKYCHIGYFGEFWL